MSKAAGRLRNFKDPRERQDARQKLRPEQTIDEVSHCKCNTAK